MDDTIFAEARAPRTASETTAAPGDTGAEAALAGSTAIIVLGMHRSGTSALTGMLHHLGVALGNRLMPATGDNPRGYWEHRDVVAVDEALMTHLGWTWDDLRPLPDGYEREPAGRVAARELREILARDFAGFRLWGVKDPRLCRLMDLWSPLLADLAIVPRFVLTLRHPAEIASSLAARDGLPVAAAMILWLRHVLEAERATRGHTRTIAHYEELMTPGGWPDVAARIAGELKIAWPRDAGETEAAVESYLAAELRHHRADAATTPLPGWIDAVYAAFVSRDPRLPEICDIVRQELKAAGDLFLPLLAEARTQRQAREHSIAELGQQLARAQHEAAELRKLAERAVREIKEARTPPRDETWVITPDGKKVPMPPPMEQAYPKWIAARAATAVARPEWVAEQTARWPRVPKLAVGMLVPAGTETTVALTLRSLLLQVAGDWVVHAVSDAVMPEAFAAIPRLVWHRAEGAPAALLNRRLIETRADWVALIDAGDQLAPHALFTLGEALFHHPEWGALYSDEDRIDIQGQRSAPHFKPDFNIDLMRSLPYVGGILALRHAVFAEIGGFDPRWDGTEEYDLALRLAERLGPEGFGHIADVLYHRLTTSGRSRRPVEAICADMPKVLQAHLDRLGIAATAEQGALPHCCRVHYRHAGPEPLVSIVVPTKNQIGFLRRCVETVLKLTEYQNYEMIIVDNGSTEAEACAYLQTIEDKFAEIGARIRVLRHPGEFNFSAMNNRAVREAARGEYICLLNNDVAPLDGAWLGEMMLHARRPEVGAVGAKLFYPDGAIQHAGVILGVGWGSPADHPFNREPGNSPGYWGRAVVVQDFSAVTAACLVTRRSLYEAVGGLDEEAFAVSYNDVDYCLKLRAAGHLVVWTPFARLLHETSASLRSDVENKALAEKNARFTRESMAMYQRWLPQIAFDPAHNRNLSALGFGFAVETESAPTWDPEFRPRERILTYAADREGCGEYRIIAPSRALLAAGCAHTFETMRLLTVPEIARLSPDSVVFQRQLEWSQIHVIERVKATSSTFRVFELDDLITNLPPKSIHRSTIARDIGDRLKKALALCDRLVVSTEPLARHYGRMCAEAVVLPNRLEKTRWLALPAPKRRDGKPRVGWAGAVGHLGDLGLIADVVRATAPEVDWVFFGMCPEPLRRFVREYHDWVPLDDYPRKLADLDLDLAVAPLEMHPFNEAKSNLRLLEYGVLGYPVLCTDILPYQCGLPVRRVANRRRAWVEAIREMVADRDALVAAGTRLREAVLAEWMLEDHLDDVRRAWLR
jgi:GT2 family glycosyltransferase